MLIFGHEALPLSKTEDKCIIIYILNVHEIIKIHMLHRAVEPQVAFPRMTWRYPGCAAPLAPSPPVWPHLPLLVCERSTEIVAVQWSANQHPR